MAFELQKLLRPHLAKLKPYSSARDEFKGSAEVYLDANENPLGSATKQPNNRYPDPLQWKIKERLAPLKQVSPNQIFLGNGSDEPIDLLIRAFCVPGKDAIIQLSPTYGMYQVSADINDVKLIQVPLNHTFTIDFPAVWAAFTPEVKIIFLCSPNNPTGNSLPEKEMVEILEKFNGLVVIDEAYIDFAAQGSMIRYLEKYPQLVILQTFSKAWGMANLRVGQAYAHPDIIQIMNKIKPPYNIGGQTQAAVLEALDNVHQMEAMVQEILEERESLLPALEQLNGVLEVFPTDANFVLVKTTQAQRIYQLLVEHGIIVRDRSKVPGCEGCLRITIGTKQENQKLIQTWKKFII